MTSHKIAAHRDSAKSSCARGILCSKELGTNLFSSADCRFSSPWESMAKKYRTGTRTSECALNCPLEAFLLPNLAHTSTSTVSFVEILFRCRVPYRAVECRYHLQREPCTGMRRFVRRLSETCFLLLYNKAVVETSVSTQLLRLLQHHRHHGLHEAPHFPCSGYFYGSGRVLVGGSSTERRGCTRFSCTDPRSISTRSWRR